MYGMEFTGVYGSVWEYMGVWECMGVYGSIWEYMGVYGEYFGDGIFFWLSHFQKVRKIRRNRRKSQLGLNDLASNLPPNLQLPVKVSDESLIEVVKNPVLD